MKNCLHLAVENKYLATLNALLCDEKVLFNLNKPDLRERVPLHYAAIGQNVQVRGACHYMVYIIWLSTALRFLFSLLFL